MKNKRTNWLGLTGCIAVALVWGGVNNTEKGVALAQSESLSPTDFEVHEWGTFTSMQGHGGLELAGLHHEEEILPHFVHDVTQEGERERSQVGATPTKVGTSWLERVTQKMETPVIYFYSKKARKVDVRVDFPGGLISQWYPQASSQSIDYRSGEKGGEIINPRSYAAADARDRKYVASSSIEWKVDVIPRTMPAPTNIPQVSPSEPWSFAREVDAAYVRNRGTHKESENYIFYRGLANRSMALLVTELAKDGAVVVNNQLEGAVPAAFILEQGPKGARFVSLGRIKRGGEKKSRLSGRLRSSQIVIDELQETMVKALVREGLFKKEAKGMVKTWSRSWFGSEGSRVIYIVPRDTTDTMLPISIEPAPDKLVRVLVGRVEYISAKTAEEVRQAVLDLSAKGKTRDKARIRISRLGRFAEAHMHNLIAVLSTEAHTLYMRQMGKRTLETFAEYAKGVPKLRAFATTYSNAQAELARIQKGEQGLGDISLH